MIKLRKILENKLEGLSIQQLIDKFLKFDEKTLIFLDVETLGLDPNEQQSQITQIGIIVIDGSSMKDIKKINLKVGLNEYTKRFLDKQSPARISWDAKRNTNDKTPEEILDMTQYFKNLPEKPASEVSALKLLSHIMSHSKNSTIICHNANFDIKFINIRARKWGIQLPKIPVMDTMKISQLFFIPALQSLKDTKLIQHLKKFKLVKLKDIDKEKEEPIIKNQKTEFDKYTDPVTGEEYLKIYYGNPSSSLGKLSPALLGKIDNWHDALADVRTMIAVFSKIIEFLREHPDLDITQHQANAIRRVKSIAKKEVKKQKVDK